jgi:formylglycine-generating enzyme required for sulfatase activity
LGHGKKAALAVVAACLVAGGIWYYATDRPRVDLTLDLGNGVTMKLVLIPAGTFTMGSPATEPGRSPDEGPQHEVTISKPFYMGIYTVTQMQYEQVMGANPSQYKGAGNPVEMVSWDDATEFCKKLSQKTGKKVRLPTEAQWEYACRAGTTTAYNTGATLSPGEAECYFPGSSATPGIWQKFTAWVGSFFRAPKQIPGGPKPVGSFKPNGLGLYDMHGNVWQWCADWYGDDYYANSPKTDPAGAESGSLRVLRGGGWSFNPGKCRSAYRFRYVPVVRSGIIGFRVVLDSE